MAEIPAGAPTPQDRKKKKSSAARRAEAEGYALIELRDGVSVRIPVGGKIPLAAIEILDNYELDGPTSSPAEQRRREFAITEALLGPDGWAAFKSINPTLDDLVSLSEKIAELKGN